MGAKGVLNWTCVNKEEDLEYLVKNGFPVSAHSSEEDLNYVKYNGFTVSAHSSEEDLNYVKYNGFTVSAHLIYDLIIGARLQDGPFNI